MKYFGIFDPKTLELSDLEIENLMLEKGLLEKKIIGTATSIENNILNFTVSNTIHIKPSKELVEEYYKFIIDLYRSEILEIKLPFFKIFNNEIYGLDSKKQKKIALDYFKQIYNTIYKDVISIYDQRISNDGIVHTLNFNKLKMLHYQSEAYKINLSNTNSSLSYLVGDRKTYIDSNFVENEVVSDVLEFEAWKQIIVELNSRYRFEEDKHFSIHKIEIEKFNSYKHIFKTLESFQFTYRKINSFKKDEKAKSVSLYQTLKNNDLIIGLKKDFKNFMLVEFGFSPTNIIEYEVDVNRTHDENIIVFSKELLEFVAKKQ